MKRVQSQPILETGPGSKKLRQEEPPKKPAKTTNGTDQGNAPKPAAAVKTKPSKPEVKEQVFPEQNATPPKESKDVKGTEQDGHDAATAAAVNSCLNRKSTSDLSQQTPQTPQTPAVVQKQTVQPETNQSDEGSSDDEEESDGELKKVIQQKAAHARYMRFSRSLKSVWAVFQSNLFF